MNQDALKTMAVRRLWSSAYKLRPKWRPEMTKDDFKRIRMNISLLYKQRDIYTDRLYELRDYEGLTIKRTSPDQGKHVYYYLKEKSGLYKVSA